MLESRSDPDLPLETFRPKAGHELGVQHLERDQAVVLEIAREIHRGHATPAELALDEIAVAESVPELACDVGHGSGLGWRLLESVPTYFDLLARLPACAFLWLESSVALTPRLLRGLG